MFVSVFSGCNFIYLNIFAITYLSLYLRTLQTLCNFEKLESINGKLHFVSMDQSGFDRTVGCVPSAAVAVSRVGGYTWSRGVPGLGGVPGPGGGVPGPGGMYLVPERCTWSRRGVPGQVLPPPWTDTRL